MNTKIMGRMGVMAVLVVGMVVGMGSLCGCRSVTTVAGDGKTNTVRVPDVGLMSGLAKSAAFLGTRVYLNGVTGSRTLVAHPEARPAFEMARNSLRALIAAGTFAPADLTAALQGLPIKEFKGEEGTLIVDVAVSLWDSYGVQLASLDKAQVFGTYVLPVAKSILEGLNDGMGN